MTAQTVGDVIDLINTLDIGVEASINDTGDGLLLRDTAGGSGTMKVADVGNGTAAADLRIAGTGVNVTRQGVPAHVIDGSTTLRLELDGDDTLDDLVSRINAAGCRCFRERVLQRNRHGSLSVVADEPVHRTQRRDVD